MEADTIPLTLDNGRRLDFRRLDDAAAMELTRLFFAVYVAPTDPATNIALWEALAAPLLTPIYEPLVAQVRGRLPEGHPNQRLSNRALWLAITIAGTPTQIARLWVRLAGLPSRLEVHFSAGLQSKLWDKAA